jgi:hypothetical protein
MPKLMKKAGPDPAVAEYRHQVVPPMPFAGGMLGEAFHGAHRGKAGVLGAIAHLPEGQQPQGKG